MTRTPGSLGSGSVTYSPDRVIVHFGSAPGTEYAKPKPTLQAAKP